MLHYYYYFLLYPLYLISPPPAMWQPLQKCGMFHKFACHPCSGSVLLFPFGWSFGIVKLGFLKSTETSLDFASIILLTINQQIMFITLCNLYLYIKQETSCKGHQYLCQRPQAQRHPVFTSSSPSRREMGLSLRSVTDHFRQYSDGMHQGERVWNFLAAKIIITKYVGLRQANCIQTNRLIIYIIPDTAISLKPS